MTAVVDAPEETKPSLLTSAYRGSTIGIVLVVTLVAFEGMAVATAMPTAVASLHGLAYYSWPFTAFLVANVIGIVAGGEISDRDGPRYSLLAGLAIFTGGLFASGFAPNMAMFVLGRSIQGLGGGLILVALYVVIAEVYDDRLRPRVFAALSAAWVMPSLVGPVVSGALTQHVTWRLVFLIIPPFAVVGTALIVPALRSLPTHDGPRSRLIRWRFAVVAAVGVGLMQYAGERLRWLSLLPLVIGVVLLVGALRRLVPAGAGALRRGLPAVVGLRGLLAGSFFAVDSFVPLTLSHLHHYGPTLAGVPLMVGALGWSAGSWWQGHRSQEHRDRLIRIGFVLIFVAATVMSTLTISGVPGWIAYPAWVLGGTGMGLVMPVLSLALLDLSPAEERGKNSAALQIADAISSAVTVGIGGVLVAAATHDLLALHSAIGIFDVAMAGTALAGAVMAGRARG
jgi:MFS family permease